MNPHRPARRLAGLAATAALLAACQFDTGLPSTAVLRCDDGVCPTGFVCRARVGVCVPVSTSASAEPPRVVESALRPARVRSGETVEAEVAVSGPLLAPPVVSLLEPSGVKVLELSSRDGLRFRFAHRVQQGVDDEGSARVVVDLVDTLGTEAAGLSLGSVELDFTPPSVVEASFSAPRTPDAGALLVRPDERVGVRLLLSEPPRAGARLIAVATCDAGVDFAARAFNGSVLDFAAQAGGGAGCEYALTLREAVDLAGNAAADVPLGLRFVVDATPPEIPTLEVLGEVDGGLAPRSSFSHQPGFERFVLRYTLDGSAVASTARLDARELLGCACQAGACECRGAVGAADPEGGHVLTVTALDAAGNTFSRAAPISFDFTAPRLVPSARFLRLVAPAGCPLPRLDALGLTGSAELDLSVDEPATAALEASPPQVSWTPTATTPTHFAFALAAVADAGAPADVALAVRAVDAVGNAALLPLTPTLRVDAEPPAAVAVSAADAVWYRRAPWGSRDGGPSLVVDGQPGAAEPGSWLEVLDGTAPIALAATADGGFSVPLRAVDRPVVSVRAYDGACNAGPAARVRNVEWLATLNGKVPGRSFENPHALFGREVHSPSTALGGAELALSGPVRQAGALTWSERNTWPGSIADGAMAYDSRRDTLILFGGYAGTGSAQVWEWSVRDGTMRNRTPRNVPDAWPRASTEHGMTYDAARGRVVAFGGNLGDELWEFDPAVGVWANRTPSPRPVAWPSARSLPLFVYDSARKVVVLLGGDSDTDLWEWHGAEGVWVDRTPRPRPASWPSARLWTGGTYDSVRRRLVVFGGVTLASSGLRELWEWDGEAGTWQSRTPSPLPSTWPAFYHRPVLAYDALRGRVLVLASGPQLWEWDGASGTWTPRTPSPLPTAWPSYSHAPAFAAIEARGRLFLFGGFNSATVSDPGDAWWELDAASATWVDHRPQPWPAVTPTRRTAFGMTFDAARGRTVVFGGYLDWMGAGYDGNDVWSWDGTQWTDHTPPTLPSAWPTARYLPHVLYDANRRKVVLFGGEDYQHDDELWEYDLDGGAWVDRTPPVRPSSWPRARSAAAFAHDEARGRSVLFGGASFALGGKVDELWEWDGDGGAWTNRTPSPRPASWPRARAEAGMVYDSARRRLVLYGGETADAGVSDEVFELDGVTGTWLDRTPPLRPASWAGPRQGHAMVYDVGRERVVVFGGDSQVGRTDELREWDGALGAWVVSTPSTRPAAWPSARDDHAMAYDARRGRTVLFGGWNDDANSDLNETWEWGTDVSSRPAISAHFSFAAAGAPPGSTVLSADAHVVAGARSAGALDGGVQLFVSAGDAFQLEGAGPGSLTAPGDLGFVATQPARLQALFEGPEQRVSLAAAAAGDNGPSLQAEVRVDWVQLTVRYRLPP